MDTAFEKRYEQALQLNSKLKEFAKNLSAEEQKGLNIILKLAEYTVENNSITIFGLENKDNIKNLRRKLMEQHCDDAKLMDQLPLTTPTTTMTVTEPEMLF